MDARPLRPFVIVRPPNYRAAPMPGPARLELRTWGVAGVAYAGGLTLTPLHAQLPLWALVPLGGWLIAWQGSLQHETIHGHPTGNARLDAWLAWWPLALWLPDT